jgi:hypothetical protein
MFSTACLTGSELSVHESIQRLLNFAKKATASERYPVTDFVDLQTRLGVSSQVITNWKDRGISKQGAIKASRLFGCPVEHLLEGTPVPEARPALRSSEDDEISLAIRTLARILFNADQVTRNTAGSLLSSLASAPEEASRIEAQLKAVLSTNKQLEAPIWKRRGAGK